MNNFSFSHSVFKRLVLQTCDNQGLFGKGLKEKCAKIVELYNDYTSGEIASSGLFYCTYCFNSLPNDKFSDWSKLKAFADDKLNLTEKLKLELERVENIVGKGENAGYQHFLLFPQCFQKASILGS